jgi:pimeloyl-ACP methyl ester carboxylesterase
VTTPVPHWPGRLVALGDGARVWVAATPGTLAVVGDGDGLGPYGSGAGARSGQAPRADGRELVLLVHGMSGSATNWTDLMAELSPDFACAAIDLPGAGYSPPPRRASGYSVTALAGTVAALIEALGAGPVHLVGNSMGGAVAVRVAASHPGLVRTLTLLSPALPDLRVRRSAMHFPLLGLPFVGEWVVRRYNNAFPARNRVAGVFAACFYDPSRLHPDRLELEVEALARRDTLGHAVTVLTRSARTLVAETLRPAPFSLWRAAGRVTAPALVLYGAADQLVHPRQAARAARTFRDSRVEVLPQAGHLPQMECPGVVAGLFRALVEHARTGDGWPQSAGNADRGHPVEA